MTRVTGTNIIRTPCCGALLSTPSYASINTMAWEYWTDGYADGSLAPGGDGLRRCLCGGCFLIYSVEFIKTIRHSKPIAPRGWETRRDNWFTRLLGRESREDVLSRYDIRSSDEIELERQSIPPGPSYIANSELKSLIDSNVSDVRITVTARRLYWRYLNDPHRDVYRSFREAHKGEVGADGNSATFPQFEPSFEQEDNMKQLIILMEMSSSPDWLEIAELRRELGDFEGATSALCKSKDDQQRLRHVIGKLIDLGVQGPVRFNY